MVVLHFLIMYLLTLLGEDLVRLPCELQVGHRGVRINKTLVLI